MILKRCVSFTYESCLLYCIRICLLSLCFNRALNHKGVLGEWRYSSTHYSPRPLDPPGKSLWYPLDRRLGGHQSPSGRGDEEKNSHPLPGLETPIIQPVAQRYTTDISRLPRVYAMPCKSSRQGKVDMGP
jgi:hypothetical protein